MAFIRSMKTLGSFMRGSGSMIREMDWVTRGIKMEIYTEESFTTISHMERELTRGSMERFTTENGSTDARTGLESGKASGRMISTSVNGEITRLGGMACISGITETSTRVSGQEV